MDQLHWLIVKLVTSTPACSKESHVQKQHVEIKNVIKSFKGMAIPFENIDPTTVYLIQKTSHGVVKKDIKSSHTAG